MALDLSASESAAASTADRLASADSFTSEARRGSISGAQRLLTGMPMDFASDYERDIGFAVQEKSLCVCDSNPHAIYSGQDAEEHKKDHEGRVVGQLFDLGIAERGQTCRAVCEKRFDDGEDKSVKSAREMLEEALEDEAKMLGYKSAANPEFQEISNNTQYEDICECGLEFNPKKGELELKGVESFKRDKGIQHTDDYELRTREHWASQKMDDLERDVVYATIPKGDTKTRCATQCGRVARINKGRAVRDATAEFRGIGEDKEGRGVAEATPLGILSSATREKGQDAGIAGDGRFATYDGEAADIFSLEMVWRKGD